MCIEYQRGKRRSSGLGLMTAHCEFGVPVPLTNDPDRGEVRNRPTGSQDIASSTTIRCKIILVWSRTNERPGLRLAVFAHVAPDPGDPSTREAADKSRRPAGFAGSASKRQGNWSPTQRPPWASVWAISGRTEAHTVC